MTSDQMATDDRLALAGRVELEAIIRVINYTSVGRKISGIEKKIGSPIIRLMDAEDDDDEGEAIEYEAEVVVPHKKKLDRYYYGVS